MQYFTNKSATRLFFFFKMFKIWCKFQKFTREVQKYFQFWIKLYLSRLCQTLTFTEREYLSAGVNTLTNSLKISDATKTKFFELKLFQSDQKIRQSDCRKDLSSLLDHLTCWPSVNVLTQGFLGFKKPHFLESIMSSINQLWGASFFQNLQSLM